MQGWRNHVGEDVVSIMKCVGSFNRGKSTHNLVENYIKGGIC